MLEVIWRKILTNTEEDHIILALLNTNAAKTGRAMHPSGVAVF
jgi:hypothetical protein